MAEEEAKTEQSAPPAPAQGGGKLGRLTPVLLGVNTLAVLALLGLQLVRPGGVRRDAHAEEHAPAAAARDGSGDHQKTPPGPTLRLADFVVHLRDPDADRYARVSFELELPDEKAREALTARLPPIRDAFLAYLSDRTTDELRGSEAMGRVKDALAHRLGEVAPEVAVRGLYVTELVVQ